MHSERSCKISDQIEAIRNCSSFVNDPNLPRVTRLAYINFCLHTVNNLISMEPEYFSDSEINFITILISSIREGAARRGEW